MSPFQHSARWTSRTLPRLNAQGRYRLLVVDDDRPSAEAITAALSLLEYEAQFVLDGTAALLALTAWVPDIVLVDIEMPGMNGYAVAGRLRRDIRTQRAVIVAFTALDEPTAKPPGKEAGFDAYCHKGAALDPLLLLLQQLAT